MFINPLVNDNYKIEFKEPNQGKIKEILCETHNFSEERIENVLNNIYLKKY